VSWFGSSSVRKSFAGRPLDPGSSETVEKYALCWQPQLRFHPTVSCDHHFGLEQPDEWHLWAEQLNSLYWQALEWASSTFLPFPFPRPLILSRRLAWPPVPPLVIGDVGRAIASRLSEYFIPWRPQPPVWRHIYRGCAPNSTTVRCRGSSCWDRDFCLVETPSLDTLQSAQEATRASCAELCDWWLVLDQLSDGGAKTVVSTGNLAQIFDPRGWEFHEELARKCAFSSSKVSYQDSGLLLTRASYQKMAPSVGFTGSWGYVFVWTKLRQGLISFLLADGRPPCLWPKGYVPDVHQGTLVQ